MHAEKDPWTKKGKCNCIKSIIVPKLSTPPAYLKYSWNTLNLTALILGGGGWYSSKLAVGGKLGNGTEFGGFQRGVL